MNKRRVVVTGLGAVTPIGNTTDEFWNALLRGENGVELIAKFDTSLYDTKFAASLKNFDPLLYIDKKALRRLDPFTQYALAGAEQAINDAKINLEKTNLERFGVVFGSGIGGIKTLTDQHFVFFKERDPKKISPFFCNDDDSGHSCGKHFD